MLDGGNKTFDVKTAGIVGNLHRSYDFGYCLMLLLVVLTNGRWKLAATYFNTIRCHHMTYCCRQTGDVLHPAECPPAALQTSQ